MTMSDLMSRKFELKPNILAFTCDWSSYAGADLAGIRRIGYPPNVRVVRVICSARVDPLFVMNAFLHGADGVLIAGCHPSYCHYINRNKHAEIRVKFLKRLMKVIDIELERLRLEWISALEGGKFAKVVREMVEEVKPMPENLRKKLEAAIGVLSDDRIRWLIGRERKMIEEGNVYGEKIPREEFDEMMDDIIDAEYVRNRIYLLVKEEPLSVKELSKRLGLDPKRVLRHIVVMKRKGLIALDRIEGTSPLYAALKVE